MCWRGKEGQERSHFNIIHVIQTKYTLNRGESQSVFQVFVGFIGLLKPTGMEEQKHEGSGEASKDQKMRRITSAAVFGLSNTRNQIETQNGELAVYRLQL